jgi:hypothetical protein
MGAARFSTAIRAGKKSRQVAEEWDDDELYNSPIHRSCLFNKKAGCYFFSGQGSERLLFDLAG